MKLLLKRIAKKPKYTIGKMYIDGVYFADTIEDCDRGLDQSMSLDEIKSKKIYGETAIPTGTYEVSMKIISPKFKNRSWAKPYGGRVPRLLNVPGYEGILIHPFNTADESYGCVAVGENKVVGKVINSTAYYNKLVAKLDKADKIEITIM